MFYQYRLQNGIEVISEPMEGRKTVALGVFIKVGSQDETKENNGISHLVEHMFFKGTKTHSAKEIADITARMGDDVNAFTSKECTALYGMTITEKMEELAGLLGSLLTEPLFDPKDLVKEKRIVMDEIDMYEDSPEDLVHELLQKRVWRDDPLGFLISGTKSVVRRLHSRKLHDFLKEHYYAENMLISAAGGYAEDELKSCLEKAFSKVQNRLKPIARMEQNEHSRNDENNINFVNNVHLLPEASAARLKKNLANELALPPYHKEYEQKEKNLEKKEDFFDGLFSSGFSSGLKCEPEEKTENNSVRSAPRYYRSFASADKDIEQLHINLAFPALCIGDKRRFAYSILNSAFGGGSNSRLFQQIREEAGMAYSVYSYSSAYRRAGLFHIDITVQPQLAVPVLSKTAEIVEKFVKNGLSEEELFLHKQQVGTELIMSSENPKTRMDSNAKYVLAGTGIDTLEEKLDRIKAVDCEQIRELAGEILKLKEASLCMVGDKSCVDIRGVRKVWESWGDKMR